MDKFVIEGGTRLRGTVATSGSKNAALPIMAMPCRSKHRITTTTSPAVSSSPPVASFQVVRVSRDGSSPSRAIM